MARIQQHRDSRRALPLAASFAVALLLLSGGCTPPKPVRNDTPAPVETVVVIDRMGPDEVRSKIASSFPAELPVAQGVVVTGRAQGSDAWDYELVVAAPVKTVAIWYSDQYERRGWDLLEGRIAGEEVRLTLRKGLGESQITLKPAKDSTGTAVVGIASVGVPVLELQ